MTDRPRARRRLGLILLVLALLVATAGFVGVLNPGRLVWVERILDHPYPLGIAAALLATVGFRVLLVRQLPRIALGSVFLAIALGWAMAWAMSPRDGGSVATARGPDRADYEAVVHAAGSDDDPVWRISVRQTGSLMARQWVVGCVPQDGPDGVFGAVTWTAPDQLVVVLEHDRLRVSVDAGTGQPDRGRGPSWTEC